MKNDCQARPGDSVQKTLDELRTALNNSDFLEASKRIGILENLGCEDIEYYTGLLYIMADDAEQQICHFSRVSEESLYYPVALRYLVGAFIETGDYLKLDEVLGKKELACTPVEELHSRLSCLTRANAEFFATEDGHLKEFESSEILRLDHSEYEAGLLFDICNIFAVSLVAAGECINQCATYLGVSGKGGVSIEGNPDFKLYIDQYRKMCCILQCSRLFPFIKQPNGFDSLADLALYKCSWEEKVRALSTNGFKTSVIDVIWTLCKPEMHPQVDPIQIVAVLLELVGRIRPEEIARVIDQYYDIVAEGVKTGKGDLAHYLRYAYSEIIATGKDRFDLKNRIEAIHAEGQDSEDVASQIRMVRHMSRKAYEALQNAEQELEQTNGTKTGRTDYGALSLKFFRVFEIEYCEKLICPVAKAVDIGQLEILIAQIKPADGADKEEIDEIERKKRGWIIDKNCLAKIKRGDQSSIELGSIRTFLGHLVGRKTKNDACAKYLYPIVERFLTAEGKQALLDRTMLNILSKDNLENYRIPGAHTGYLLYSEASAAAEYVQKNLPDVVSWFK